MNYVRQLSADDALRVGWGIPVLLASGRGATGATAQALLALGGDVVVEGQIYDALSHLIDDPRMAEMLVVDCDDFGGQEAGRRAFALLDSLTERLPVILISKTFVDAVLPLGREAPIYLRAPVTVKSLRTAFEHAFAQRRVFAG